MDRSLQNALILCLLCFGFLLRPLSAQVSCTHDPANCCWVTAGSYELTQSDFSCTEMYVASGVTLTFHSSVNQAITFNISGDVEINGTIDVSANGRIAGPGGGDGGEVPTDGNGHPGDGLGAGEGGIGSTDQFSNFTAGGGAGAIHSGSLTVTNGISGSGGVDGSGNGGEAKTSPYGNPLNFRQSISAGSGGGAGGAGSDGGSFGSAGHGGGGGGALRIIADGMVWLNGSLLANAGSGDSADVTSNSGGGGGGSGGSLFIAALQDIIIDPGAQLRSLAGSPGAGDSGGGNGSSGDHGYIHLEDRNETIAHASDVSTPNATTRQNPLTIPSPIGADSRIFQSDLATGCAFQKNLNGNSNTSPFIPFIIFLLGFMGTHKLLFRLPKY